VEEGLTRAEIGSLIKKAEAANTAEYLHHGMGPTVKITDSEISAAMDLIDKNDVGRITFQQFFPAMRVSRASFDKVIDRAINGL
jgi:hypothetical protein